MRRRRDKIPSGYVTISVLFFLGVLYYSLYKIAVVFSP
jgi:hypothetical protein